MTPAWIHTLERLLSAGELPASEVPRGIRSEIENWGERTGCLSRRRQGRGVVLVVTKSVILDNALRQLGSGDKHPEAPMRARNLEQYRDTKIGNSQHDTRYYLLKGIGEGVRAVKKGGGEVLDLSAWTAVMGCVGFALGESSEAWTSAEPILLVENQSVFDDTQWLPKGWRGLLLYYQGELSRQLVEWLGRCHFGSLTLFPDYDGVGLQNFARLKAEAPHAQWHWQEGWEQALERCGNSTLWGRGEQRKSVDVLWARWASEGWPDPKFRELMERMRQKGMMLEQEWVHLSG